MAIVRSILGLLGIISLIPSFLFLPAVIGTAIYGSTKNDYTYLKKFLKIWGLSLATLVAILLGYALLAAIISA